ncbi:hypothetical protein FSARC_9014 [Fusarium sarcochroum]|uniref:Uncharacterized protein n=1 Tax=Fusarium sarcochroum TaxID=1208366 RepID=A0A8H4X6N0_9HYPO|nr:hypothetical protein FSARC_9014 [Fusarium sarcochroum]
MMSTPSAWKPEHFGGLTPQQRQLLYEPIILECALQKTGNLPVYKPEGQPPSDYDEAMPDFQAFQFFVNKVAQVCDNERGGDTVTALAILQGSLGPHYVFGSNLKDENASNATRDFVQSLLDLVGKNPEDLNTTPLKSRALWLILSFNVSRLVEYLEFLKASADECLQSCRRREEDEDSELVQCLRSLENDCNFTIDNTDANTEQKSISDCETLIKAIHTFGPNGIHHLISERAKDGEMTRSEPWCNLRHFLGRWHSYRQAAETLVAVAQRWPELFEDYEITMVPSGSRIPKPIEKSDLTSSTIVQNIAKEEKIEGPELQQIVEDLQQLGLDAAIASFQKSRRFKPLLHAEVSVHAHLEKNRLNSAGHYWRSWNYIGGSKPICRLCHYYFEALEGDKPHVRPSHYNLYYNWRLPDLNEIHHPADEHNSAEDDSSSESEDSVEADDDPTEAHDPAKTHHDLLVSIAQKMRDDVKRTLKEKKIRRKTRDSNTYSTVPEYLQDEKGSSASGSNLE